MGVEGNVPESTFTEDVDVQLTICGYWVAMVYPASNSYGVQDDISMILQICTW